jgi:RNA polymerase sigma-70 factor (ECF subfamily)
MKYFWGALGMLRRNRISVDRTATTRMLGAMESLDEDAKLMERYRDGDTDAFSTLYAHHKGPLYRYLLRHVRNAGAAADLFQEVWSRLIATRARYEARAKFATFLFHIAHNCTMDFFRRDLMMRRAARPDDADAQSMEPEVPEHQRPDGLAEFAEQQSALLAALGALPREQRETFLLHEETGLTIEEIARVTDVGIETVKSRLRYAIRKLKNSLLGAQIQGTQPRPVRRDLKDTLVNGSA